MRRCARDSTHVRAETIDIEFQAPTPHENHHDPARPDSKQFNKLLIINPSHPFTPTHNSFHDIQPKIHENPY
jgi:hypothetical protein